MATISASIRLQDNVTQVAMKMVSGLKGVATGFDAVEKSSRNIVDTRALAAGRTQINNLGNTVRQYGKSVNAAAAQQEQLNRSINNSTTASHGFASSLRGIVTTIGTVIGLKKLADMSDTYSQTTARVNMMNDGLQTTAALQEKIYQAALNSHGSYQSTIDAVSKLGLMAGAAFSSSDEIVQFAEQLNKQFVIGGTSVQSQQAAMLQLTQAMASGVLRGDELNSVYENAPLLIRSMADYMGVPVEQMRELAAQGAITTEVMKNGILGATEQTNAAFSAMGVTFGQVWQDFKTKSTKAWEQVNKSLNALANTPGLVTLTDSIVRGIENLTPAIASVINSTVDLLNNSGVHDFIGGIIQGGTQIIGIMASAIPPVIDFVTAFAGIDGIANGFMVLAGGVVAFKAAMAGMGAFTAISGLVTSFTGAGTAAAAAETAATAGTSGIATAFAAITGPVALVAAGIAAVTAVMVGAWQQSEIFRNSVSTAFDSVGKTITAAMDQVKPALDPAMQAFQGFATEAGPILQQIGDVLGTYVVPAITWFANTMITAFAGAVTAAAPLLTAVGNVFSFIGNGVGAVCAVLNGDWAGAWNYGGAMVQSAKDAICNSLLAIWQMGEFIFGGIITSAVNSFNGIVSFISGIGGTLQDAATETFWNVVIGATNGLLDLYTAVTTGFDDALAFVRDLPDKFNQWGRDMIQGMIDGIKNMAGGAVDAVGNIVNDIITRFKQGFGIASPAKETYEIGTFLMQGLINSVLDSNIMTFFNGIIEDIKNAFANGNFGIKTFIDFVGGGAAEFLKSIGVGGASLGQLVTPLSGGVTSGFGYRDAFMTDSGQMSSKYHEGIDIGAAYGAAVGAAGAGTVTMAGWNGGYGNTVMIDHGNGLSSMYAHLSSIMVAVGDVVKALQTIGLVGSTGNSTGPHLHFGLYQDGAAIDPSALWGYANGTTFATPGLHLVGEHGPEIVNMAGGEKVLNANKSKAIIEGAGRKNKKSGKNEQNFNFTVQLTGDNIISNDMDVKKIANNLAKYLGEEMQTRAAGLYSI